MFAQLTTTSQRLKRTLMVATAALAFAALPAFADGHGDHSAKKDIVDTAVAAGQFNTLVTAVTAAGLVETLKGEGPFTVFAPNDAAFAKIPKADLDALLADKDKLSAVLTYHVVPGKMMAADLAGKTALKTVQGGELTLDTSNGVTVDGASVISADIETSNGVIHVIDSVVLPK
ncbi:fasciclin domain-containing protein [Pseudomonas sp. TMP25]|uniref:fasciclin domain-containing protein n=1 Tax=Pseudomonas sp. TMP25 TaxID=3136561 RepID=UPI003101368F